MKREDGTIYPLNTEALEWISFDSKDPRFVLRAVGPTELLGEILQPNEFTGHWLDDARDQVTRIHWNRRNYFAVKLVRPVFLRVLALVLLVVAILWLIYLAVSQHEGAALANVLVYLAALWAVRDILSGKSEVFPTVVDYSVLFFYVCTILIVFTRAALKWNKRSPSRVVPTTTIRGPGL